MENIKRANLEDPKTWEDAIYNDGELALIEDINDMQALQPVKLEVFAVVLVQEGKARVSINGVVYEVVKDDLFICPPNNIVADGLMSLDFKGKFILLSAAYVQRLLPLAENAWDIKMQFEKRPVCSLQPEEASVFCQYYDLLCSKVRQSSPVQKKVIDSLVLAFIYDMQNTLSRVIENSPRPFTSGEALFKRFVDLIEASYPKPRMVSYYADRLNVTPKYLSAVCKKVGEQPPSDLIDSYVLKDIDYLLRHTQKSIKEIVVELDFPNLSFFGKYVRKHLGVSPKFYREKAIAEGSFVQHDRQ